MKKRGHAKTFFGPAAANFSLAFFHTFFALSAGVSRELFMSHHSKTLRVNKWDTEASMEHLLKRVSLKSIEISPS